MPKRKTLTIKFFLAVLLTTSVLTGGFFIFKTQAAMIAPDPPPGPSDNQDPVVSQTMQYKLDGQEPLAELAMTAGDKVVFGITLGDIDNDQVKFRLELCPKNDPFDINCGLSGTIMESDWLDPDTQIKGTSTTLTAGEYKWRIKAFDNQGGESDWQEFGIPGNVDFKINPVPKYTQNESEYPSLYETRSWFNEEYAFGFNENYYCGSTIANCGCAITSAVMTLRYHGIYNNIDSDDVNPLTMNAWLKSSDTPSKAGVMGYYDGNVNWKAIEQFAKSSLEAVGSRLVFLGRLDGTPGNQQVRQTLDNDLDNYQPDILRHNPNGHFLVATEKLASTYLVNDPFWYNTQTLNQDLTADNWSQPYHDYIYDYNNFYNGLRRFTPPINCKPYPCVLNVIDLTLASPAELLVVDPLGRRLGLDPLSGTVYNEIPQATYTQEGIGNPENPGPSPHQLKSIWIPAALGGEYQIKVIGTGEGDYTLFSTLSDAQGGSQYDKHQGHTQIDYETGYILDFNQNDVLQSQLQPQDTTPPATIIHLSGQSGQDDWYLSSVEVSLSAQDADSGVYQILYSQDNGQTWHVYDSQLDYDQDGIYTLLYRSEDFAGNLEDIKTQSIKIDTTPPEAQIFFDPQTQQLVWQSAQDATPPVKTSQCLNRLCLVEQVVYTFEDPSGQTLQLFFLQPRFQNKISGRLQKIQYNNEPAIEINKNLHYFWTTNWFNKSLQTLSQSIGNLNSAWVNAFYTQKTNQTVLALYHDGFSRQTLPGLVIVKLYTYQGELNYTYENQ